MQYNAAQRQFIAMPEDEREQVMADLTAKAYKDCKEAIARQQQMLDPPAAAGMTLITCTALFESAVVPLADMVTEGKHDAGVAMMADTILRYFDEDIAEGLDTLRKFLASRESAGVDFPNGGDAD